MLLENLHLSCDEIHDQLDYLDSLGTWNFDVKFTSLNDDISSLHGLLYHDDVLPSDLTLELVTGITQLKTGAVIVLKVTSPKPILKDIILKKLSINIVNIMSGDESSFKFQKKIFSPTKMMMRVKTSEEGQYVISTKLYGHHVTNSPVTLPVMDDPEKHLAEMGIHDLGCTTNQPHLEDGDVMKEQTQSSSIPSKKAEQSTRFEESDTIMGDSVEENVQDHQFNGGPNFDNEREDSETISAKKVEDFVSDEAENPIPIDFTDVGRCPNDQDYKDTAYTHEEKAILNDINGLKLSRGVVKSAENLDFALQQSVMMLDEDNQWKTGVIEDYVKSDNIYIVKCNGGYAGVAPGFIKSIEDHFTSCSKNSNENFIDGATAVGNIDDEMPNLVGDIDPNQVDSGNGLREFESDSRQIPWTSGDKCFAKWTEDNIWYNARVLTYSGSEMKYSIRFTDYGNEDLVDTESMVLKCTDIPEGELVDDHVLASYDLDLTPKNRIEPDDDVLKTDRANPIMPIESLSPLRRPSLTFPEPITDPLSDEGADDELQSISSQEASVFKLPDLSPVPPSLQCILCKKVAKRAMVLKCDSNLVLCWNCGVMKINVGTKRECWVCHKDNISTNHMVKRVELRETIEAFTKTGTLPSSCSLSGKLSCNIHTPAKSSSQSDILSLLQPGSDEVPTLHVTEVLKINAKDPAGVAKLGNGNILILDNGCSGEVLLYDDQGKFIEDVRLGFRPHFHSPSDILVCRNGDIVISDKKGLHIFDSSLKFIRTIASDFVDEFHGLTEDDNEDILTINFKQISNKTVGKLVSTWKTSVLFIDRKSGELKKIMNLEDVISGAIMDLKSDDSGTDPQVMVSQCTSIKFKHKNIYITGRQ